jgi:hypothetical protein
MEAKYTVDCRLCNGEGFFCPGCTRGKIQEIDESLFMGCGSQIRCPLCYGGKLLTLIRPCSSS